MAASVLLTSCKRGEPDVSDAGRGSVTASVSLAVTESNVIAKVALRNTSAAAFPVLKFNLPQNGEMTGPLFVISYGSETVTYTGWMAKRIITADSYYWLQPGGSMYGEIPLEPSYDLRKPGKYVLYYLAYNQMPDGKPLETIRSSPVSVALPDRRNSPLPALPPPS